MTPSATREGEVRAALDDPAGTSVSSNSLESWNNNAKASNSFYAMSGGKFQNLIVDFHLNSNVKNWSSSNPASKACVER